jgi:hypothetical protein
MHLRAPGFFADVVTPELEGGLVDLVVSNLPPLPCLLRKEGPRTSPRERQRALLQRYVEPRLERLVAEIRREAFVERPRYGNEGVLNSRSASFCITAHLTNLGRNHFHLEPPAFKRDE